MKCKGLITITILFFIMIAAVSASDNTTTDNLTDIKDDINVTFDDVVWKEDLGDINVTLPEEATGDFAVKINDEVIYNQTITSKSFKVPITLPVKEPEFYISVYPPIDSRSYKVSACYNNIDLNITTPLKVMNYPPDYNMLHFPEEILKGDTHFGVIAFPRSANGTVEFYIDDKLFNRTTARSMYYWDNSPFSKLSLGKHTFRVIYYGDRYYSPYNKTFNFTVENVIIDIPKTVNIGHDDCISVRTLKNVDGNVKVYIDNKLISNSKTDNGEYILSLEEYIKYTDREIKIAYTSKNFSRTKTQTLNMTYDFDFYLHSYVYGDENTLELTLPDTLNNNLLSIKLDGVECRFKKPTNIMNNIPEYDISNLGCGNHTLFVSFKGDDRFYPLNRTYNFTVNYQIRIPWSINYKSDSKVYLKLPADAKGNLTVQIDDKLYRSVKFNNGYAEVIVNTLGPGRYMLSARYDGDDYGVEEASMMVYAGVKIDFKYAFTAGEDSYITVEVPSTCTGYVIININDKDHKVQIKNGRARYSLKNLKAGEYDVYIDYFGDDGNQDLSNWISLKIYKPKLKIIQAQASFKSVNVKVKVLTKKGKAVKNKLVTVKFNGKTFKVKTNSKGILTFKKQMKLKNKKYALKITYMGAKITKKIKAVPFYVKITKTKKKLILKAVTKKKAKNQVIKFKIKGKTFKVKTNTKGIAKLSIKKPKKIPTIKATYLKNTLKI